MKLSICMKYIRLKGRRDDQNVVGVVQKFASCANYGCLYNALIQPREGK